MAYIASNKNQNWLLPLSICDMIPRNHICFLVEDFVESLDFSNFDLIYEGPGHPAYHPRIIMKILIYGMLCKTRSSRNELIVDGVKYRFKCIYTRKKGKKIVSFWNHKIKKKRDAPYYFKERLRMRNKMENPESKKIYSLRKITVEPVYGNLKHNLGFREFLLRSLEKVKTEFNLVCIAHNLQKIWKLKQEIGISC